MVSLQPDNDTAGAHRASWLRAGLVILGVLVLLFAGAFSASAASSAASPAFPSIIQLPNGWQPEGIASGRGTDFYVGSVATGAVYKGDFRTGEGSVLVPAAAGRVLAGMKVDNRTNYLFASGAFSGKAFVFDASTGALLAEYQLATPGQPTFINDVVVTRDAAYFTDSSQPYLYKLPLGPGGQLPDASQVQRIPLGDPYVMRPGFNANGIDATPNGKTLIIVQTNTGFLFTVDVATGGVSQIDLGGATVVNGDGILLEGKTLYVVQNQFNKIAVIDLNPTMTSGTITGYITNPAFQVPTTIAPFGKWLYAVNAKFGMPADFSTPYEVVQVGK